MGRLLTEYDQALRKLQEDFLPHTHMVNQALLSLLPVLDQRYQSADLLRKTNFLSIIHNPSQMARPADVETVHLSTIPLSKIVRWVSLGYLLVCTSAVSVLFFVLSSIKLRRLYGAPRLQSCIYTALFCGLVIQIPAELGSSDEIHDHVHTVLSDGFVLPLYRNEVLYIHAAYEAALAGAKDTNKKLAKSKAAIAEQINSVLGQCPEFHRARRVYLRQALRQLALLVRDKPGLLGPHFPLVLAGMSLAKDEILWLFYHANAAVPKAKAKLAPEQLQDA